MRKCKGVAHILAVKETMKGLKESLIVIYVGDAHNVVNRVVFNHCRGNVEASALRRHVAEEMGYKLKRTKRPSGSTKVRIDLPDPQTGERKISTYIQTGKWKYVICESYHEAHDFQWYVIEKLNPLLNREREQWNKEKSGKYLLLLQKLSNSQLLECKHLYGQATGPGVYVFYHSILPD